jgi:hypothetical protein
MAISKADSKKMQRLAQEGKTIAKIVTEDFPSLDYWEVYFEVYGAGEKSSLGVKRTITNRLNELVDAAKTERKEIVEELHGLVWHLYNSHKTNTAKLAKIRAALD